MAKRWFVLAVVVGVALATAPAKLSAQGIGTGGVNVLTWHNDTYRTGQNLNESALTYQTINKDTFGQICAAPLTAQVYAEPLVVTNVTINNVKYGRVVYVVTMDDTLYAIDGDPTDGNPPCKILNGGGSGTSFLFGHYPASCHYIGSQSCDPSSGDPIAPSVGILGTPVINLGGTGTIYFVAETQDKQTCVPSCTFYHWLYAVDIQSFAINASVQICSGGCGKYTSSSDFSQHHIQRPGLLFANCGSAPPCNGSNYVYAAFSMMDASGYPFANGVIFGYNAVTLSTSTLFYFQSTDGHKESASNGGGMWMGGAGLAFGTADSSGKNWIYASTANGTFDLNNSQPPNTDAGDSFIKLDPNGLSLTNDSSHYFTPADQFYRSDRSCVNVNNGGDVDLGSGGPMLIPDNQLTNWPYLAVTGDKEGGLWFINRTTPGGHLTSCDGQCDISKCNPQNSNIVQTYWTGTPYAGHTIHGGMAFWEYDVVVPYLDWMYAAAGGGQLFGYPLCTNPNATSPIDSTVCTGTNAPVGSTNSQGGAIKFIYGTTPSVTANGQATDAVVWAIENPNGGSSEGTQSGVLYAFDAVSMVELYDSNMCTGDSMAPPTKFSVPTIANGYVYIGAEELSGTTNNGTGTFYIFGMLGQQRRC